MILARKKLFTQATKNLEKAKKLWDGEESELAQASSPGTDATLHLHGHGSAVWV